jgi:hypothetical protein
VPETFILQKDNTDNALDEVTSLSLSLSIYVSCIRHRGSDTIIGNLAIDCLHLYTYKDYNSFTASPYVFKHVKDDVRKYCYCLNVPILFTFIVINSSSSP